MGNAPAGGAPGWLDSSLITEMNRLSTKRCLIVGGTSGIGRAAAERFVAEGARLVIAGNSAEEGQTVAAELAQDGEAHFVYADAAHSADVENLFKATLDHLGGLDVLYHVAGGSGRKFGDGPLHECVDDGWQNTLRLNLTSTFLTNRAAVRLFLQQDSGGVILNVASVLALAPSPRHFGACAYTAAKGGIIALSRLAASQCAPHRIRVNVLAPGLIDTPMSMRAMTDPAVQHYLRSKQPLASGAGRPEDCAEAAVFLCSDEARLVTGLVLPLDAGWSVSEGQYGQPDSTTVE
jgi:NAD(P)-dependent dehydrogenase (short-subunit alcohol dehydrogenase family)